MTITVPNRTTLLAQRGTLAATLAAIDAQLAHTAPRDVPGPTPPLAWGARVSAGFRRRTRELSIDLGCSPDDLMTCMAWESARTFRPDVRNMAGSGAVGLIQFMPTTAEGLHTSTEVLAKMSAEDQLEYVARYFAPYRGRLHTLADLYMAILWPAAVGKPADFVLWNRTARPTTYRQNAGLDVDRDGNITKAEAASKVAALLPEGLRPGNVA